MTLIVDGYALQYEKTGKGPAVLLLHGWGDKKETFKDLSASLKGSFTVYTLDLPGFGGSEAPRQVFGLDDYAHIVAGFLDKVGVVRPYAVIGHSNGGAILIKGLSSGVLQADKAVLLASSGVRGTYKARNTAVRLAAKTAKIPTKLLPVKMQNKLRRKVYDTLGSDMLVAENLQDTFKRVVSEDVVHESAMISLPTLLVYGEHDTATPVKFGEMFANQIEKSKLVVIENAGHFVHHDQPQLVLKHVMEFLK